MSDDNVCVLTDKNFQQEVIKADTPVLVDFWAEWCGPCRQVIPIVKELANEYMNKIKVGKLDTDKNQNTAASYGITAVPTIIIFKKGKEAERIIGLKSKKEFKSIIDSHLQPG